ncbi:hypothetical protein VTP01DRAFT_3080 [Rhizomucor pusillus]|uniref:uncharacterized protein n=1 Tax=Rhizomucor pusillus TaxID=4840 RepID=UPI003741FAB5
MTVSDSALFKPVKVGTMQLQHRVVLAPLTRLRHNENHAPTDLVREYYNQRTLPGGFLISEANAVSAQSGPLPGFPGLYSTEQIQGWKKVTDTVHAKGGYIFAQLCHSGRVSSSKLIPNGAKPVSASAIAIQGKNIFGDDYEVPRPLEIEEIKLIIEDYAQAARNAIEAGFDGVELHGANGHLLDQFINTSSNKRTDEYGGSIENRSRLCLQVLDAIVAAVGAEERIGIRLSPWCEIHDMEDETPYETWGYIVRELQARYPNLAYLHFIEPRDDFARKTKNEKDSLDYFRVIWKGVFVSSGGYTTHPELATKVADETGNLIAFGRSFIANPDLPLRLKNSWPLNKYDRNTFYTNTEVGYTDYPFYDQKA